MSFHPRSNIRRVGLGGSNIQMGLFNSSSSARSHSQNSGPSEQCQRALDSGNIVSLLRKRRQGSTNASRHRSISNISQWVESLGASSPSWKSVDLPDDTRSTISLCFSPDGSTFASTHGDHTVKIVDSHTGVVQHVLSGHPRTPWTVKFHPTDCNTVASGCLAGQVFVWDVRREQVRWRVVQERPIISLAFHPEGDILGIAAGKHLFMWRYTMEQRADIAMSVETSLRAVMFPSNGSTVIIGIANPPNEVPVELAGQDEEPSMKQTMQIVEFPVSNLMQPGSTPLALKSQLWRDAIKRKELVDEANGRVIVKHAVLYNDGGMDISDNGTRFVCCMYQPPPPPNSPSLLRASDKHDILAQSPRSTVSTNFNGGSTLQHAARRHETPPLPLPPPPPTVSLPPQATTSTTSNNAAFGSSSDKSNQKGSGLLSLLSSAASARSPASPPPQQRTSSSSSSSSFSSSSSSASSSSFSSRHRHPPVAKNRARAAVNAAYDSTTGRRVRPRRRPPPAPLFQLATVGLDDHNYGKILAYQTVEWKTAKGTTSVKFSPSSKYVLVGYGVRVGSARAGQPAVVVSMYRTYVNQIVQVQTIKSTCDDLNIALFHPQVGGGFVFGTKRGNVRRIGLDRHAEQVVVASDVEMKEMKDSQNQDPAEGTFSFFLGNES